MTNQIQGDRYSISVMELLTLMDSHQPVTILDLRSKSDQVDWSIPGSVHIDEFEAHGAADSAVVTVCGAGVASLTAARQLRSRGIRARSLTGGMKAWSLAWNTADIPVPDSTAEVVQVRRLGKGCLSYLIGDGGKGIVVDASLDPEVYIALAEQRDWSIGHVLDTHVHADHLSRSRALADKTGATLHLPNGDQVSFPVELISDGDVLSVGDARLVARATPGHTMGSMTYQLDESALITGDTLFLEGVGRPDLEASAEETQIRARLLYQSLVRLSTLPDDILILPGHTSAPIEFNGEPIADSLVSVRKNIDLLQLPEEAFVHRISSHIPPAPQNHAAIVALNAAGAEYEGEPADLEAGANRCAFT